MKNKIDFAALCVASIVFFCLVIFFYYLGLHLRGLHG